MIVSSPARVLVSSIAAAQRADAVSGSGLANAVAWNGIHHIKGAVNRKDRRLG